MKNKKIMIGLVGIFIIMFLSNIMMSSSILISKSPKVSEETTSFDDLIPVNFSIMIGDHGIYGNYPNWSYYVENYDWCSGRGLEEDPYIIEGIHVTNENMTAHISIEKAEHFIIRNVTVSNYAVPHSHYIYAGIYIGKGEYGLIQNCTIINSTCGISMYEAKDSLKITDCNFIGSHDDPITGMAPAIVIQEAKGVNISYNNIYNFYSGIIVRDAEEIYIENNRIETCFGYVSQTGVYFYYVNDSSIINNDFYNCNFTGHNYTITTSSGNIRLATSNFEGCYNLTIYGNRFYSNIIDDLDDIPDNPDIPDDPDNSDEPDIIDITTSSDYWIFILIGVVISLIGISIFLKIYKKNKLKK